MCQWYVTDEEVIGMIKGIYTTQHKKCCLENTLSISVI